MILFPILYLKGRWHMKNNQPIQKAAFEKPPISELLEENSTIQWISENGQNLLIALLFAIALFFTAYRFSSFGIVKSELNYINAENEYERFIHEKDSTVSENALKRLSSLMVIEPDLNAKYDGLIAEKLIIDGKITESLPFAERTISRTKSENSPFYTEYSETALLIGEKKYEEALNKSLILNAAMIKNKAENSLLFAFNLLRIGILQQELQLLSQELSTWTEWDMRAKGQEEKQFTRILNHFNVNKLSLTDYIESRKTFLKS